MKRVLVLAAAIAVSGCDPNIPTNPTPSAVVTARMDLTVTPPVAPAPNDLATNPKTGKLAIPLADDASAADQEFAAYLDTLDGFPGGATAATTFDAKLSAASVTADTVKVLDLGDNSEVSGYVAAYADTGDSTAPGLVTINPPATGWLPGHTYGIAILGGDSGVKGGNGEKVVASANWALLRSLNPLVVCPNGQMCQASTALVPSTFTDPKQRAADTLAKATQLEALRQKYKPFLDHLDTLGHKRADVAIAWSFKISDDTKMGFYPTNVPPIVPAPNDLAIDPVTHLVNAPVDPSAPAAAQEFTTDYLNTLDGFPAAAAASATVLLGDLDPSTVSPSNVLVLDAATGEKLTAAIAYVPASGTTPGALTITPPQEGWGKGKHVAVVVTSGVTRSDGQPVVATEVWALARSSASLVTCSSVTPAVCGASPIVPPAECAPALTLSPLSAAQAVQLECLRLGYAPLLDALPIERADNAITWVFSTVDSPEAVFDPANGVIPFPNDLVYDQSTNHVNLPVPAGAPPALQQLIAGLNTLDGFSTTAPTVSENADYQGAIDIGHLDPASFDAGVQFFPVGATASTLPPEWKACLNCRSSVDADGGTFVVMPDQSVVSPAPDQLQIVPLAPLDEKTRYAVVLTTDLTNTDGKRVVPSTTFALLRSKNTLLVNGHSAVPGVSDAQAGQLEPIRAGFEPIYDALELNGIPRKKIALAWTYRTQSTVSTLATLQTAVGVLGGAGALPTAPDYLVGGGPTTEPYESIAHALGRGCTPDPACRTAGGSTGLTPFVEAIYTGTMTVPYALTGTAGTFNPNPQMWSVQHVPFLISLPGRTGCTGGIGGTCSAGNTCAADGKCTPNAGHPVLLFGHGLTRGHSDMVALSLLGSKGYATVAADVVFHGDRVTCTGSGSYLSLVSGMQLTDDYACANPATMKCDAPTGRCVDAANGGAACTNDLTCLAVGQGKCTAGGHCENADFARDATGIPTISGWNFLNLNNLFVTRDNFRNTVLDNAQWVRILNDTTATGLNSLVQNGFAPAGTVGSPNYKFNPGTIDYVGQSLGTFNGSMTAAVNTNLRHVGLNVAGSDQTLVLLTAPAFVAFRNAFEGGLAQLGIVPGTPGFDQFIVLATTILDPADSRNAIHAAVNSTATGRETFIQYIEGDTVLPNPTTEELIAAGTRGTKVPYIYEFHPDASFPVQNRHGFLLDPSHDPACTPVQTLQCSFVQGQVQMNKFITTGNPN
ncbi:MAG: hypothetical protein QM723_19920 [Myxococcaceae bacterium]